MSIQQKQQKPQTQQQKRVSSMKDIKQSEHEQHQIDMAVRLILEARALKIKQKAIEHELQTIRLETLFVGGWLNTENTYVVISDERGLYLTELTPCIKKPEKPECPPNTIFKETDL